MMKNIFPELKGLERKALFLSLLCHIIFLKLFVLTFSSQPVSHKPSFTFLGSILTHHEFSQSILETIKGTKTTGQAVIEPIAVQSQFSPKEGASWTKPIFFNKMPEAKKLFLKSTFLENKPIFNEPEKNSLKDATSNLSDFEYIPLRLP